MPWHHPDRPLVVVCRATVRSNHRRYRLCGMATGIEKAQTRSLLSAARTSVACGDGRQASRASRTMRWFVPRRCAVRLCAFPVGNSSLASVTVPRRCTSQTPGDGEKRVSDGGGDARVPAKSPDNRSDSHTMPGRWLG